jgi:hypothetical protein
MNHASKMSSTAAKLAALLCGPLLASLAAAKPLPPPSPDPQRGSIAITIRALAPMRMFRSSAAQVFFIRVEEGADPLIADGFLPSNHVRGQQVFLLNVRPGKYVAVAADIRSAPGSGFDQKAFFSESMIPLTEVTVNAGEFVFAGEFVIANHVDVRNLDRVQKHYYALIAPEMASKGYTARAFSREGALRADLERATRDAKTEKAFWTEALKQALKSKEWNALIKARLVALANPTPQPNPIDPAPTETPPVE